MRPSRTLATLTTLTALLWAASPRLAAQGTRQIFVSLVAPDGAPITDLKADEVSVTEDGVLCPIVKLERANWPTKLHVLFDNNEFVTNPPTAYRNGLAGFFQALPAGIEMSLYVTAGSPRAVVRPTTDKQKLLDGIGLIAPDSGAGMFVDALFEAARRIDQDKTPNFPVIVMVGSDIGDDDLREPDFLKLQNIIRTDAVTVHVVLITTPASAGSGTGIQDHVAVAATTLGRGRYESIGAPTRLATLLPELGRTVAERHLRQVNQYRVTYQRPANSKEQARVNTTVRREGTLTVSGDGRLP